MAGNTKQLVQLKIGIAGIEPQIWRRLILNSGTTLHELHRIIQLMFEWYDYHLYRFKIGGVQFEAPNPDATGKDSTRVTLSKLRLSEGEEFTYVYDYGDYWEHRIEVEHCVVQAIPDDLPLVVAGERCGPPEDCGGVPGFERLLEAINNPDDPEHDEYRKWVGEGYSPDKFDVMTVRHAVSLVSAWGLPARK